MRRPEEFFEVGWQANRRVVDPGLGQEREDPAAVVVHNDDRRPESRRPNRRRRVEVVKERQIPDDGKDGRPAHRRPERR